MGEPGYIFLWLALLASLYSAFAHVIGERKNKATLLQSARNGLYAAFGLITPAVGVLLYSLLSHDFGLEYVYFYSSRAMSPLYRFTALWAGNSGSLLFWAWLMALFATLVALRHRRAARVLVSYASAVNMVTLAFFIVLLLAVANPFARLAVTPADGHGMNPLLEHPAMIIHPPLLLAGYVAMTIPFAFAVAALAANRLSGRWLSAVRGWAVVGWLLLGTGNIIGAWWAYVELGWGGYWAWDPVENAGLLPMLVMTAFLHSSMMERRQGLFRTWNVLLLVAAFNLAIFGTFLTRSGVLPSVHAFLDTGLGPFFAIFLLIASLGPLGLLVYRRGSLAAGGRVESLVSRPGVFLLTNLIFVGAALVVLFGTIFPLLSEVFVGRQVVLDRSFFDRVAVPLFLVVLAVIPFCTVLGWRSAGVRQLGRALLWPALGAALVVALLLGLGVRQWYALISFLLCAFVAFGILWRWYGEVSNRHRNKGIPRWRSLVELFSANHPRYGGYLVHLGVVLLALGITGSTAFAQSLDVTLIPGREASIGGYTVRYEGLALQEAADRSRVKASLILLRDGRPAGKLEPEKQFHRSFEQPVTEVAIRSSLVEDLYVILIGWDDKGAASFSLLVNPMVSWMWIGGGLLLLGGVVALWPTRARPPLVTAPPKDNRKAGNGSGS